MCVCVFRLAFYTDHRSFFIELQTTGTIQFVQIDTSFPSHAHSVHYEMWQYVNLYAGKEKSTAISHIMLRQQIQNKYTAHIIEKHLSSYYFFFFRKKKTT